MAIKLKLRKEKNKYFYFYDLKNKKIFYIIIRFK